MKQQLIILVLCVAAGSIAILIDPPIPWWVETIVLVTVGAFIGWSWKFIEGKTRK